VLSLLKAAGNPERSEGSTVPPRGSAAVFAGSVV